MTADPNSADPDAERYRSIVETVGDGVIVFDTDGEMTFVNQPIADFTGQTRASLIGASLETLGESGLFDDSEFERLKEAIGSLCHGADREQQLTIETAGPDSSVLNVRLSANRCDDTIVEIVGIVRDVTERERAVAALERDREALQQLYEVSASSEVTEAERLREVLEIGCDYLDLPYGFLTSIDGQTQELVDVVGDSEILTPGATVDLEQSYCRRTVESDGLVGLADVAAEVGPDDVAYQTFGLSCYIGTKVLVDGDLHGTFCFAADDARETSFSPNEQQFVKLLGQWAGHTIERQQFEERLRGLNDVAGELLRAESTGEVAQIGVDASADLLDLPVTACWKHDPTAGALRPLAETDACLAVVGETPTFTPGDGLVWRAFDADELRVYEDLTAEPDSYNRETALESEVHVPLGDHGVLISGATELRGFGDVDVESLRLLGGLMEAAMVSVKRRESLVERGETIRRQNEQLEEFARVVAHDLRNPLAGAVGFLEIARETHAEAHFDRVEGSLDRMDALIGGLLDIARGERTATDESDVSLEQLVDEAWSYLDDPAATLAVADDLGRIEADETRLLQLLGNLFRNAREHVGEDVTVTVGRLRDGDGFYVENDGPSFPAEKRQEVLLHGQTTSEKGTGIGLMSVTDIASAHGWAFDITEADGGGARFEFRVDGADQ
ncbi:GAF domain-containing protein [Haloarcula salinisoli]|uniref:histidine kinase n=1 Tax=Haloarcula salinisoli TaxID=2487746 RepID=A0A8J7YFR0_9EURY|nr:GAF domain-containing protein [Halomicroarcula salinisoli]MBX0285972.1 PAS domain S-box protein [Halomicroarcula salinisoli]MBX0302536.1 PAS domain S-box protein [Halomicroarcula salinisoli]